MSKSFQVFFSDPILEDLRLKVFTKFGPILSPEVPHHSQYFSQLTREIIGQQLSGKVANVIDARVRALIGKNFTPQALVAAPHEALRAAGLSNAKANYIQNIAEAWESGRIVPEKLAELSDEEVITKLSSIKGVGRWTAEMFLMFTLGREDVFAVGDYGLRKAIEKAYKLPVKAPAAQVLEVSNHWKPHRSLASRVLWKSLELD